MTTLLDLLWRQPARVVAVSFLGVAMIGGALLAMPVSHEPGHAVGALDAFFTAVSAVCVTGLIVVDTPTAFSTFGEAVILILIQLGGLGIMMFSIATVLVVRRRLSIDETELLSSMLNETNRSELRQRLRVVFVFTIALEAVGALLLFAFLRQTDGIDSGTAWSALFHAVSAFCNAGFSLNSDSLSGYVGHVGINLTVIVLIVTGGLGFSTLALIGSRAVDVRSRRNRIAEAMSRLSGRMPRVRREQWIAAQIALAGSAVLTAVGFIVFYLLETGGVLSDMPIGRKYLAALFQSVTLRTAGFNTVDIGALAPATLLALIPFMFIGGGTGGTAGGVKIGTVAVIGAELRRFVRGETAAVLYSRRLPASLVTRALLLVMSGIVLTWVSAIALGVSEPGISTEALLFEIVSALGTVGLSTGITGRLSSFGRVVIIVLMFVGRLGPLTLLAAFRARGPAVRVTLPTGEIPIG